MKLIVTGYFNKQNYGDDLFKDIAATIFKPNLKYKKQPIQTTIIPIYELVENKTTLDCDFLILFGGETLNNYFLDTLIQFKKINVNPSFRMVAIGVSCNQEYTTILNKIQIFDYISFRSKKDYEFFQTYIESSFCPDIALLLKPYQPTAQVYKKNLSCIFNRLPPVNIKTVGFFLAQTAVANKPNSYKHEYIQQILVFINFLLKKGYTISLFSLCINDLTSESDIIINTQIYNAITDKGKHRVNLYTSTDNILRNMSNISYAICWRYHAHILSIIHTIPFLSLSTTPKVTALLAEHNLEHFYVETDADKLIDKFIYLVNNKPALKITLTRIYSACHTQAKAYRNLSLYFKPRHKTTFYLDLDLDLDLDPAKAGIFKKLVKAFNAHSFATAADKTRFILFFLMRSIQNEYSYGLQEKIAERNITDLTVLKDDIQWLINDCILKKNIMFYEALKGHGMGIGPESTPTATQTSSLSYNFCYIDQDNYKGLHRAGWSYVVDHLRIYNNSAADAVLCDLYLDRTFHWNCLEYAQLKVIPYTKAWVGFIHHTADTEYSAYNTAALLKNKYFLESLPYCKGLLVLSTALKQVVEDLLTAYAGKPVPVPVFNLVHPTEFTPVLFDMNAFTANKSRKIIQVGAWLRVLDAINHVALHENPLALSKCVLKCKNMHVYFHPEDSVHRSAPEQPSVSRDKTERKTYLNLDVTILDNLNNEEYDKLLQQNIVFIQLVNASAVNTLIECIVRHTPIIVNRLPATVEMLGKDYPLFYDTVAEVSDLLVLPTIQKGWLYLKNLNKKKFTIKQFLKDFTACKLA
jgi:polysaccharide pyruvyl transferase WcaK-like protein